METKIKRMRERLVKYRKKITDMEAVYAEMEQEIKKAEEEQLSNLARTAANTLSGGMEDVFEILRNIKANTVTDAPADQTAQPDASITKKKEDKPVDEAEKTEEPE